MGPVSLRRVASLFKPYRARLGLLLSLIFVASGLGVMSPFLLREMIDVAFPQHNTELLTELVLGMIALSIVRRRDRRRADLHLDPGRPARDARPARRGLRAPAADVARVLHANAGPARSSRGSRTTSAAWKTSRPRPPRRSSRTSRPSSPRSSRWSCSSWQLAVFSLVLTPFFIWITRRVGEERKRIQAVHQSRLADVSSLIVESLSVSGILLGKTMGRSPELVRALPGRVRANSPTSRCARAWPGAGAWRRCR